MYDVLGFLEVFLLFGYMFFYDLFGNLLYIGVYGSVDVQFVLVDIVMVVICFFDIFVVEQVFDVFSQFYMEIWCDVVNVGLGGVFDVQRLGVQGIVGGFVDQVVFLYLFEYYYMLVQYCIGLVERVKKGGVFQYVYEYSCFVDVEFVLLFVEIDFRSCFDVIGIINKVEFIEVYCNDFFFGILVFEVGSNDLFFEFLEAVFLDVFGDLLSEEEFGQLLSDGRVFV